MSTRATNIILGVLILATFAKGAILYPLFPDQIASHWNAAGEADGFMQKFWGIFLLPIIMVVVFILYFIIPRVDPLRTNIELFRKYYNTFWISLYIFLMYIFGLMMTWNLGYRFDFTVAMVPAVALFFYAIGTVLEKSRRNWFFGIRTPWTLSNDVVWEKTHALGGKLFKIASVVPLLGIVLRNEVLVVLTMAIPAAVIAVVSIVYSYVEYRKQSNQERSS